MVGRASFSAAAILACVLLAAPAALRGAWQAGGVAGAPAADQPAATGAENARPNGAATLLPPATSNGSPRPSETPATARPVDAGSSGAQRGVAGFPWLPTDDGRLVPVPPDGDLEEYLEFLEQKRKGGERRAGREYSVAVVALEGRASENSADLTATIDVEIDRDGVDVLVPLALAEARLVSLEHRGPGEARFDGFDRQQGYRWWFRGKGRHTLELGLLLDVQKQPIPARRISLSVPPAAVSYLKLDVAVPADRLTVLPAPDATVLKTSTADGGTEIKLFARDRMNLGWQPLPEVKPVEAVLQVETTMRVEVTGESVLLNPVIQRIGAVEGRLDSVAVWLPAGFEVLEVTLGGQVLTAQPDPHTPGRVTVRLPEPVAGPIELQWRLRAPLPANGRLTLDGFRVDKAMSQRGEITVHAAEGYGISRHSGEGVHRINVAAASGNGRPLTAYSFWKQPFSLELDVEQVPPYLTTDPYYFVLLRDGRAQLIADLWFDVHEGAVDVVQLNWPGFAEQGWTVQAEPPGLVERTPQFDPESGTVRIQLVRYQSEGFRITLRAERDLPVGGDEFVFELPGINASSLARPVVVVANAHNVESRLTPAESTLVRPLGANLREKAAQLMVEADLPLDYVDLRRQEFRVESEQLRFTGTVTLHAQEIETESFAALNLSQQRLEVIQELVYHVDYEPLAQVRLAVPQTDPGVAGDPAERFAFVEELEDGTLVPLPPSWSGLPGSDSRLARCVLSEPRIGTFRLVVRYEVPPPSGVIENDQPHVLRLPVVSAGDGEPHPLRVRLESNGLTQLRIDDPAWTRQLQPGLTQQAVEWRSAEPVDSIPLTFAPPEADTSGEYTAAKAALVSLLRSDGSLRCVARFRFEGAPASLPILLPGGAEQNVQFWWDRQRIPAQRIQRSADGESRFLLTVPPARRSGSRLLTVEYELAESGSFGLLQQQHLVAPRLPGVWVEQSLWRVVLPDKQHLSTTPADFVPRFRWMRQGLLWSRQTPADAAPLVEWIGAQSGPELGSLDEAGSVYEFTRFGPADVLRFRTISSAALIAAGAGFAWAAGFILLTVPRARNLLTVLTIGFCVAVAATWFPTGLAVLLQPILLGLALAVLAAAIDWSLRRKRLATVITFSSPSDYAVAAQPSSSVDRPRSALVGSNDATAMRNLSSYGPLETLAAPESGSRA